MINYHTESASAQFILAADHVQLLEMWRFRESRQLWADHEGLLCIWHLYVHGGQRSDVDVVYGFFHDTTSMPYQTGKF
jgi:hypothetical protein